MRLFSLLCFWLAPLLGAGLYAPNSQVRVLNAAQFQKEVQQTDDVWLIEFYADWCGHCKAFASEYELAAEALRGVVKFAAVSDETVMGQFKVQGFPTVMLFGGRSGNKKSIPFNGNRQAPDVTEFVLTSIRSLVSKRLAKGPPGPDSTPPKGTPPPPKQPSGEGPSSGDGSSALVELKQSNFNTEVTKDESSVWFVMFYAPWCGHCKRLEPTWANLATKLGGRVKVGKVDATVEKGLAKKFAVEGLPTLILFPANVEREKHMSSDPMNSPAVRPYQGPRELDAMASFAQSFVQALPVLQLTSETQFRNSCSEGVCVLAILPHILDVGEEKRAAQLQMLEDVRKASGSLAASFIWSQGGDQFALEEAMHLAFGYPAVVVLHLSKEKFAVHRGAYSVEAIQESMRKLTTGDLPVEPLPGNIKIKTVKTPTREAGDL